MARPRPVLIFGIVVAVLGVLNESADAANLLPGPVFPWVRLLLSVLLAIGGALFVQKRVTPVADPRDDQGNQLVPAALPTMVTRGRSPGIAPATVPPPPPPPPR